jgi:DNA modification methylase
MIDIDQEIGQEGTVIASPLLDNPKAPFTFQGYGLVPIGEPTFEEWLAFGENIKNVEKGVHFWIGDWLNYGEAKWGEMYKKAIETSGFEYDTVRHNKYISSRIELGRRRPNLSFSHHEEVAPNTPEEQEILLDHAEKHGWSAKKLRREKGQVLASIIQATPVEEDSSEPDQCTILDACPITDLHAHIEAESLDAIITDPPYPREYLSVYNDLADFAIHALKPGGSLIAMVGQYYLPDILATLQKEPLKYHWLSCYYIPGDTAKIWHRRIGASWKPLIWFVKGKYTGPWKKDVIKDEGILGEDTQSEDIFVGNGKDKKHHEWGQPVHDMVNIIEHFTQPGQLICDPFLGGGTTAVASLVCNRRFIGSDIDKQCIQTTRERVKDTLETLRENQIEQSA